MVEFKESQATSLGHPMHGEKSMRLQAYSVLAAAALTGVSTAGVTRTVVDEVGATTFTFQDLSGPSNIQRHLISVGNGQTSAQLSFGLLASMFTAPMAGSLMNSSFYIGNRTTTPGVRFSYVGALQSGGAIGGNTSSVFIFSTWTKTRYWTGTPATSFLTSTSGVQAGVWAPSNQSFFIGLIFGAPGSVTAEGWVEMTYDPNAIGVTIHDWYVGAAGEEVFAGSTAVPSLPALATLACGAAGLRRRRQRAGLSS